MSCLTWASITFDSSTCSHFTCSPLMLTLLLSGSMGWLPSSTPWLSWKHSFYPLRPWCDLIGWGALDYKVTGSNPWVVGIMLQSEIHQTPPQAGIKSYTWTGKEAFSSWAGNPCKTVHFSLISMNFDPQLESRDRKRAVYMLLYLFLALCLGMYIPTRPKVLLTWPLTSWPAL